MSNKKTQLLLARLQGIVSSIERDGKGRTEPISLSLSRDFNSVLKQLSELYPEYEDAFPEQIPSEFGQDMGYADASFLDLRIKAEQIVKMVEILTEGE